MEKLDEINEPTPNEVQTLITHEPPIDFNGGYLNKHKLAKAIHGRIWSVVNCKTNRHINADKNGNYHTIKNHRYMVLCTHGWVLVDDCKITKSCRFGAVKHLKIQSFK